jgi:hypothetical protein
MRQQGAVEEKDCLQLSFPMRRICNRQDMWEREYCTAGRIWVPQAVCSSMLLVCCSCCSSYLCAQWPSLGSIPVGAFPNGWNLQGQDTPRADGLCLWLQLRAGLVSRTRLQ